MKICICLSAYNGEKYIKEQINSILSQTVKDFELWIRDDLSTDNTIKILKSINDDRIHLVIGTENIGFKKSFYELLKNVEGDWFLFCDQDDYWESNKLETMLSNINKIDNSKPILFFSDAYVVDSSLNVISDSFISFQKLPIEICNNWKSLLAQNVVLGCSTCFNNKARDLFITNFSDVMYHDHLLAVLVSKNGKIQFIPEKLIKYRQHGNNVIGSNNFSKKYLFRKIRNIRKYLEQQKKVVKFFNGITLFSLLSRKIYISFKRILKRG